MHIRLATIEDVPNMLAISNAEAERSAANFAIEPESLKAWQTRFTDTQPRYPNVVALSNDTIVGFAKGTPWNDRCAYLHSVMVSVYIVPEFQRRGIGRTLYDHLFNLLQENTFHTVIAGITPPNEASVQLHESMDMKHIGTFPEVGFKFETWHDVGYWTVPL